MRMKRTEQPGTELHSSCTEGNTLRGHASNAEVECSGDRDHEAKPPRFGQSATALVVSGLTGRCTILVMSGRAEPKQTFNRSMIGFEANTILQSTLAFLTLCSLRRSANRLKAKASSFVRLAVWATTDEMI